MIRIRPFGKISTMKRAIVFAIILVLSAPIAEAQSVWTSTKRSALSSYFRSFFGFRDNNRSLNMRRSSGHKFWGRNYHLSGVRNGNRRITTVLNRGNLGARNRYNRSVLGPTNRNRIFVSRSRISGFRTYRGR